MIYDCKNREIKMYTKILKKTCKGKKKSEIYEKHKCQGLLR